MGNSSAIFFKDCFNIVEGFLTHSKNEGLEHRGSSFRFTAPPGVPTAELWGGSRFFQVRELEVFENVRLAHVERRDLLQLRN